MHFQEEKESPDEKKEETELSTTDYDHPDNDTDPNEIRQNSEGNIFNNDEFRETDETSNDTEDKTDPVKAKDLYESAPSYLHGEHRQLPEHSLAYKTLHAWRFGAVIEAIFLFVFPAAYWGASQFTALPTWGFYALIGITIVWGVFHVFIWQSLSWSRWKYQVYEDEVELMFGVIIKRRIIIPMIRVQHVDTRQGPVLRYLGLASVTISTAATVHEVPGLTIERADQLRDQIAELAREADPDE
ncbi:PH domain-containing protein [Salisediminibacterium beveridgei]|uniref:YdbS-like PH domain-containing protein n=1 Tax=Salisediminibacterium beveridgei TaxID=632773 RepID=A0A1D7QV16_9BACI|nr:PH domain-containing protein [Salisediminibacterium beveridgei]AOM82855.1 hypothetical protein BBEV_1492 [Salisediminibacterium beveridgei]